MKITNQQGISLPLAVWLLHDEYDHVDEPNYISATSLLRPTKQLILAGRTDAAEREIDLADNIASRFGNAVHDSVERAWRKSGAQAMRRLGYPEHITDNLAINPSMEELRSSNTIVPVWIEQRTIREFEGYKIGGKFDMVLDGRLFDFKTTSVWSYILGGKDEDYALQGSIYRWLNPTLITSDHIYIQFIFTDWQRLQAQTDPKYPKTRVLEYPVKLLSLAETERYIKQKLHDLSRFRDAPEDQIPACTDKELWRTETTYKYFANPDKTAGRSTRNFTSMAEAQAFMTSKGGKGVIKTVPGEVKACAYCPAFTVCKQKDQYYGS